MSSPIEVLRLHYIGKTIVDFPMSKTMVGTTIEEFGVHPLEPDCFVVQSKVPNTNKTITTAITLDTWLVVAASN